MNTIIPQKLKKGDEVRVIAPALSLSIISEQNREIANERFKELGLKLSFGRHVEECDEFNSSSIESRIEDLHEAFADKNVKAIFSVIGGFNSNQMLSYIDWDLIKNNPKIFCGYSDITALQNAIFVKTRLVTYSGPAYATFGQIKYFDYTLDYFKKCLFEDVPFVVEPSKEFTDDKWYMDQDNRKLIKNEGPWIIHEGKASGIILGANLCTFNLLQGTEYMPSLADSILFLEDDESFGESSNLFFDRNLVSLIQQPDFDGVKGIVIGRFQLGSKMTRKKLEFIINTKKELNSLPIIANVDFGHTSPIITFPIGGEVIIEANKIANIKINEH